MNSILNYHRIIYLLIGYQRFSYIITNYDDDKITIRIKLKQRHYNLIRGLRVQTMNAFLEISLKCQILALCSVTFMNAANQIHVNEEWNVHFKIRAIVEYCIRSFGSE